MGCNLCSGIQQSGAIHIPIAKSISHPLKEDIKQSDVQVTVWKEKSETSTKIIVPNGQTLRQVLARLSLSDSSGLSITSDDVDVLNAEMNLVPLDQRLENFESDKVDVFLHEARTIFVLWNGKQISMDKNKTVEDVFKHQKVATNKKHVKAKWGQRKIRKQLMSISPTSFGTFPG